MVRIEPAQARGPHERGAVGNRLARDVERRHERVDDIDEVGGVDALDFLEAEDVDRNRGLGRGSLRAPRTDRDHFLEHQSGAALVASGALGIRRARLRQDRRAAGETSGERGQHGCGDARYRLRRRTRHRPRRSCRQRLGHARQVRLGTPGRRSKCVWVHLSPELSVGIAQGSCLTKCVSVPSPSSSMSMRHSRSCSSTER